MNKTSNEISSTIYMKQIKQIESIHSLQISDHESYLYSFLRPQCPLQPTASFHMPKQLRNMSGPARSHGHTMVRGSYMQQCLVCCVLVSCLLGRQKVKRYWGAFKSGSVNFNITCLLYWNRVHTRECWFRYESEQTFRPYVMERRSNISYFLSSYDFRSCRK